MTTLDGSDDSSGRRITIHLTHVLTHAGKLDDRKCQMLYVQIVCSQEMSDDALRLTHARLLLAPMNQQSLTLHVNEHTAFASLMHLLIIAM